ncbi:MAG: 50S ribosomal protein L14e [Candidatus Heimdallarchaeota archaeon]|nr:50S ribosomal protein L14e [Candidatus Heimdallarchaeota archaeon]
MSAIEIGRIVTKIMGREAGNYAVVTQLLDKNFVEITGPNIKRRRVNISHIEPTPHKLDLSLDDNSDDTVNNLIKKNNDLKELFK